MGQFKAVTHRRLRANLSSSSYLEVQPARYVAGGYSLQINLEFQRTHHMLGPRTRTEQATSLRCRPAIQS